MNVTGDESAQSRLLLVRHRQSTWNAERRWSGQADPPLSAHGEVEAAALGEVLAPLGFDVIISSDLARARRTAELIADGMPGSALYEDARLREIDIPVWTGRTKTEINAAYPEAYERWRSGDRQAPAGAERWDQFERRVVAGLHASADRAPTVLVVAHSGVLRAVQTTLELPRKISRSKGIWIFRRGGRLEAGPQLRLSGADA